MNKQNILVLILVVIAVTVAGYYLYPLLQGQPDYKNISYQIDGQTVTLKNGLSEVDIVPGSASKSVTRYFGNEARGDFNGDGMEDVAFLLTQNNGGSGTFYYLVVALKNKSGYQGTNGILLGDRIAPQTTEWRDGFITVNYADRKPGEPMTTQPSVGISRHFKVNAGQLIETF